jgi:DNA repair protein NreA
MNVTSKCLTCKGRDCLKYCGTKDCLTCKKLHTRMTIKQNMKQEFSAESVAPFIGRYGYPHVNVGMLSPPETKDAEIYDAPRQWSKKNYNIPSLVELRSSLVNSRTNYNVRSATKAASILEITQDIGMSSRPVDVDIKLTKVPKANVNFFDMSAPMGPAATIEKAIETQNPKIDSRVWRVYNDSDLKASEAITSLYAKSDQFDENFLTKMLSVGAMGVKTQRRLVPTRWSITATDDTLGKHLINKIKDFNIYDYAAYLGSYLGNYYLLLFFPEVWSYELFEMYSPKNGISSNEEIAHTTDNETYGGRKNYADNTAGGYYTVRLAILEHLIKLKRQSSCLALRFITDDYTVPLGVWVTREASRNSTKASPIIFDSKELLIHYAKLLTKKKFNMDITSILNKSKLLKSMKQRKLNDY